ncbi:MAG: serine/threonine-protein kinase [Gemmatimonadales bacterium]|jgi:serine/threonine protein kinase
MTAITDALKAALANRYVLRRTIGRGGMATVYLAHDVKHRREVAVKVLRPDLAAAIGTERFLKEIEIAAGLTHPHIVPLYDSGEAESFLYYVMPFIEGESLRTRLNRLGRLRHQQAIGITTRVAGALDYAHRRGVLHRDIKPENVLFSEGHALVTDFGIAKAVSTAGDESITRTGIALGTPGYMSPEQAAGLRELDASTDVFGLACVLYEMLIGETPGMWLTDEAVRLGRFVDASPQHRARLDQLSGSLEQVLAKALALRIGQRYTTPREFADALASASGRRQQYSDAEVKQIIKHAAQMQAEHPTEEGALSVGGMERVAAEVGIPPDRVRDAARDVAPRSPRTPAPRSEWSWFLGRPSKIQIERVVDREVTPDDFGAIIDEVRRTVGNVGHVSTLGGSLAWSAMTSGQGAGRSVQLSITPRRGTTRIYLEEQLANVAGGLFGGIMGGGGGAGLGISFPLAIETLHMPALAALFGVIAVSGSWGIARSIFVSVANRRRAELEALADRLVEQLAETARDGDLGAGPDAARLPPGD